MDSLMHALELFRRGNGHEAERICERLLARAGEDRDALSLLAEIHAATGKHERAAAVLARFIQLQPEDAAAHRRLAGALAALGRTHEAVASWRRAIQIEPGSARAHNNLGLALTHLGNTSEAIQSLERALKLDPAYALAHHNLGLAHIAAGNFDRALPCFELALANAPHLTDAWVGRGTVLANLNRLESAVDCFDAALDLRPGDAATLTKKAFVLLTLERANESLGAADAALRIDEHAIEAHNVRAGALRRLGQHADALRSLERALALDPTHPEAWRNHSTVLHDMGQVDAALVSGRKALELEPADIRTRTRMLARLIPPVPLSAGEAARARDAFDAQLLEFESWLKTQDLSEHDTLTAAQQQFFYLSYQEKSNRGLLERYRGACVARLAGFADLSRPLSATTTTTTSTTSAITAITATSMASTAAHVERRPRRFRLGIVSAHVYDHSVFNALVRGWLDCLDRARFDITLFNLGSKQDAVTQAASASVDQAVTGPRPLEDWIRSIRGHNLDALIYPEIGMHEATLALASLKLAKRQYAAWGHPETSGLPTLDGYLSAELFEPPNAQEHYSERLIRLPNLGVHCRPYATESARADLEGLGITGDGPVFICPGVPFKYSPEDDRLFVEIARRLQPCTFVFFQHEIAELSHKLMTRIAAAFDADQLDSAQYLRWISWQPRAAFFGLLQQADVYLDTVGFSGFNTMMQAIECHLPCVTYEGRFMRGRLGSGILQRLGMPEWIARDKERYIELAVKLGADPETRAEVRATLRRAKEVAFGDAGAVDALARVLLDSSTA